MLLRQFINFSEIKLKLSRLKVFSCNFELIKNKTKKLMTNQVEYT